jgi:prepilin-type N-terminal cleavage/methylation domain-containing protein
MARRAFTLIELILTILIIGLIIGFVYPDLDRMFATRKLEESAEELRSLLVMARSRAMRDGIRYRVQFPGTPDPLDKNADPEVDVPFETKQPEVFRQDRPLDFPDSFAKVEEDWTMQGFLKEGVRCVATFYGTNFDETSGSSVVGPAITEGKWEFVALNFNPDGTCDHLTFRLTDLPFDIEPSKITPTRVIDLIVDGRTGQTWFQRAFTVDEKEVMEEYGASPILHMDFNSPDPITEENILMIHVDRQGRPTKTQRTAPKATGE